VTGAPEARTQRTAPPRTELRDGRDGRTLATVARIPRGLDVVDARGTAQVVDDARTAVAVILAALDDEGALPTPRFDGELSM